MPPPPSFDCYAELQVERSASLTDINSAYRRLARIHHPDKNPDNQEEATTIFQRLQLAHETLSDPVKRARYDKSPPGDWDPFSSQEDDELWQDDDEDPFGFSPLLFSFLFAPFFTPPTFRGPPRRGASQGQAAYEDLRAEQERRRQENKRREEEAKQLREKEQRQRREAQEAREKAAERSKALARLRLRLAELKKQEKRWEEKGAVSKDERLRSCLHSEVCDKVQHAKKFKCTACLARRGMIAFECPHCSALLCQLCVNDFSERRMRLEIQEQTEEQITPKDIDKPVTANPTTGIFTTKKPNKKKTKSSTKQSAIHTSKESISGTSGNNNKDTLERDGLNEAEDDEVAPTSGGQFASNNPYDILAGDNQNNTLTPEKSVPDVSTSIQTAAPLTPARPDDTKSDKEMPVSEKPAQSRKKRHNKKPANSYGGKENVHPNGNNQQANTDTAVEPRASSATHSTHRQTLAPGSSGFSPQDAGAATVSKNTTKHGMKANANVKPQKPAFHNVPSRQQNRTGPGRCPTPGATSAYVRTLDQAYSPTVAVLRQAMEKFGAIKSLAILNKRNGTAHVDFATHDGLCRAMTASPVVVGEEVTVRVLEWRHYDTRDKAGHVAQSLRDAKSKGPE